METDPSKSLEWLSRPTLYPKGAVFLRRCDAICQALGVASIAVRHGLGIRNLTTLWESVILGCMVIISVAILVRYRWSLAKPSFAKRHQWTVIAASSWIVGVVLVQVWTALTSSAALAPFGERAWRITIVFSEIVIFIYALFGLVKGLRKVAANGVNPALVLVGSFGALITIGTLALMLPVCTAAGQETTLLTACFTATSASCVTGLVLVDTGVHWTRTGQCVILALIQVGGLGIMTFGAFFAAIAGRNVALSEAATLRDLLGSEGLNDVRRVVFSILGFTLGCELTGAVLLLPLWPELPIQERMFQAGFHSVSAFCNAGFALTPNSFVGMAHLWPVWGVLTSLIILGGIGFVTLYNGLSVAITSVRRRVGNWRGVNVPSRERLTLTTRLVIVSSVTLLLCGTCLVLILEYPTSNMTLADAWFQSVTFRTAGFNTVELGHWQPATKLIAILMMVIGASPGSTGGGVKTTVFGVAAESLLSVLRGRDRIEAWGRTIPAVIVNRALTVLLVYVLALMSSTILVILFENRPEAFLDHLFEATSAIGTVGLTSLIEVSPGELVATTKTLTPESRIVIIITMFLGRVGPLTLLLALAGEPPAVRYEYPPERVTLG